ncbi:MAG: hypothetical protein LBV17_09315, partial [Treponema sp.]|nr:hypothetical protein [Treponema sp.]
SVLFCCFAALAIGKTRRPFIEKNFFFEKLLDSGGLHISYRALPVKANTSAIPMTIAIIPVFPVLFIICSLRLIFVWKLSHCGKQAGRV